MSCAQLATNLDVQMLLFQGVTVFSSSVPDSGLPVKTGAEVARELAGRPLLRYLRKEDANRYLRGDENRQCVTPTPYSADDVIGFLNLPDPATERSHFLLLQPERILEILGPRYICWGQGIEYILPRGFKTDALVNPWAVEMR